MAISETIEINEGLKYNLKLELVTMRKLELNILILLLISNGQVVAPFTFVPVSIGQVHIGTAELHLVAARLRLVRHLTLHVGGVTATHLTHYTQ